MNEQSRRRDKLSALSQMGTGVGVCGASEGGGLMMIDIENGIYRRQLHRFGFRCGLLPLSF
jgi:hypothetical protein